MIRQAYGTSCCCHALILLLWIPGAWANEDKAADELKSVQSNIVKLQMQLDQHRAVEHSLFSEIQELERKLMELKARQRNARLELEDLRVGKMQLGGRMHQLRQEQDRSLDDVTTLVLANHVFAEQDGLGLLLKDADPTRIGQNLQIYRYFIKAYEQKLEAMRKQDRALHRAFHAMQERERSIDRVLEQVRGNQSELVHAEASRSLRLEQVRSALEDGMYKVSEYKRREQELQLLLDAIREEARQRKIAQEQAEPRSVESSSRTDDLLSIGRRFRGSKGNLELPVKAKILNRFGQKRDESGLAWDGVMLQAREGDPVSAVYQGEVVFSDWFGSYGQLMILEHGEGYMSLYGHNQQLHAPIGTMVETGQLIASVGKTGGLESPALYFEIRYNGSPDDPLNWCRL